MTQLEGRKKPTFIRQDSHKKVRLARSWRRPKGLHSKMRLRKKGYHPVVKIGWGAPGKQKHLHPIGKLPVRVFSVADLVGLDNKLHCLVIGGSVGAKNRIQIAKSATAFTILNLKDVAAFEQRHADKRAQRTAKKALATSKKAEKKEKPEKKEPQQTDEEKKRQEKLEKDRALIKPQ